MTQRVKIGIVGIGGYGKKLTDAISRAKNLELAACCHPKKETAEECAEKYRCRPFCDFEEMLKDEKINGVIIATPNHLHCEQIKACARNKKNIFVEKPITNKLEEAEEVIRECENKDIIMMVGHNFRRGDAMRKMKQYIDNKKIGDFVSAEINISHSGGMKFDKNQWRYYRDKCPGGPLIMAGVHAAELSNYFFGPAKRVVARVKNLYAPTETEDTSMLLLELESGGVVYICNNYNVPATYFLRVYGTKGILEYNYYKKTLTIQAEDTNREQGAIESIDFKQNDTILEQLEEFGSCILGGKKPETDGKAAFNALAIVEAALLSQKENKFIEVKKLAL
ncbi:Gfo/Idh/MocA family oxidoreductase [Patescibacteria group bacterium]|nr:Gfo/Idh/MocA family oxidoreductase [Patescibacteria group bacterium]